MGYEILKTVICEMFDIQYPIFQGGMAWISDAELAAAVSEAGGLGIIAAGNASAGHVLNEIKKAKKLTDKPFGVNIMLMSPYAGAVAQIVADEKVRIVVTGAGNPSKYMQLWNEADVKVIPVIASCAMAKILERCGASAVIAEGIESGGHVGELTTMTLVPQVRDVVNIPVIAAGGIGDGRGIAAAFMLGACGVQVGTRFLVAKECNVHQNYKDGVLKARDIDTLTTGKRLGHPVRALKNSFLHNFLKKEYDSSISNKELEALGAGALRSAAIDGDITKGCFMAGQISGLIKQEQSAKEIIEDMLSHAERILSMSYLRWPSNY